MSSMLAATATSPAPSPYTGGSGLANNNSNPSHSTSPPPEDLAEIGHVVFTALPPGSVSTSFRCSFISSSNSNNDNDVIIVKSNRIEVRSYSYHGDGGTTTSTSTNNDNDSALHAQSINVNNNEDQFPLLLTLPINGRIVAIAPIRFPTSSYSRDCLLFTTEKGGYALISYDESLANSSNNSNSDAIVIGEHYPIITHASGNFQNYSDHVLSGGRQCECGPLLSVDPLYRCVAMHLYDGYLTVLPINKGYDPFEVESGTSGGGGGSRKRAPWGKNNSSSSGMMGGGIGVGGTAGGGGADRVVRRGLSTGPFRDAMHLRLEERTILSMTFLEPQRTKGVGSNKYMPQIAILHQDCYGYQHVISHGIDLQRKKLVALGTNTSMDSKALSSSSAARGGRGLKSNHDNDGEDGWDDDDDGGGKPAAVPPSMPPLGEQLKINKIEGGSGCLIAVPPPSPVPQSLVGKSQELGGVLILGQRLVTYHSTAENITLRAHTGGALLLSWCRVIDESYHSSRLNHPGVEEGTSLRYLIGDERGRIHLLSLIRNKDGSSRSLSFDTLGTASTSSSLVYLGKGRVFVGSSFGNSQLVKILDEPIEVGTVNGGLLTGDANTAGDPLADTTFVEVLEEYDNLGPVVDFDLRPCSDDNHDVDSPSKVDGKYRQSLLVTCSGVAKDGTVRLVRNGVGMREHASVDMEGIKGMWSLRRHFHEDDDSFLVQSFVRETRVLGVQSAKDVVMEDGGEGEPKMDDEAGEDGGALAEVTIPGFNSSKSTLFSGNLLVGKFDLLLQVVEDGVRLVDSDSMALIAQWSPFSTDDEASDDDEPMGFITVASANESGQIIVALRGGVLVYLLVEEGDSSSPIVRRVRRIALDREISCIDLNPFGSPVSSNDYVDVMDIDNARSTREARKSLLVAVGLWDDFSVRLLNLNDDPSLSLEEILHIHLGVGNAASQLGTESYDQLGASGQHLMARSLCLVTMDSQSTNSNFVNTKSMAMSSAPSNHLDMLLVGLGDGKLISFVLNQPGPSSTSWSIHSRKEVTLGTQGLHLIPFHHGSSAVSGSCVLATGDRPTVVYLTGGNAGSNSNPKLNYSTISLSVDKDEEEGGHASHTNIAVNVAAPFRSSLLFSTGNSHCSSLCMADENCLRLGMIDNIEKLHVTTFRLGMTPRRIAYHSAGRVYCVGCIAELELGGEANQNNCIRFFDDSTFEELNCISLEPFEMILTIESVSLGINLPPSSTKSSSTPTEFRPFIVMGTAYAYPDEDEPSQGRVLVIECNCGSSGEDQMLRHVRQVADLPLMGGIYSIAPFYGGNILVTCGSDTILCQLSTSAPPQESSGKQAELLLNHIGSGHHGHLISLFVKSLVNADKSLQKRYEKKQRAIVGDLMRSISLVEYHPKHQVIEEVASDFNSNFCTEVVMLTDNIFMGSEGHNNLFVLQYNTNAATEQARIRLDTVGQYHLGENVNKMIGGSLVMPSNNTTSSMGATSSGGSVLSDKSSLSMNNKIDITIGSQTLYGTVDGTIGSVLGLGGKTFAFMSALQRAMDAIVRPVGDLSHAHYRAWQQDQNKHRACGFVDGDWIETFLDLNRPTMERVVREMNIDPKWTIRDDGKGFSGGNENRHNVMDTSDGVGIDASTTPPNARALSVEDVLGAVEEISMLH